ncbi:tyrosyl-tRNA synthetase [Mucilaginibacter mallensis]|uniref:Tyrosine--tRNA ligase n=1 Tax=Mucilaginibacter mallensis TaxID=652787 RepID=A0A1H1R304_MUCMA|nr:tyrosine--tRNA ligase [Mucilaginibacter mallensis]SDS30161.1 tyrosyl-tRNA synthetase [Mucilaginibacter mallensis]
MNFVEELRWRGMLHDIMPGTEELLNKGMASGYIGFDPTADSLHVGSLAQIMTLIHFQRSGHKPYALVGGATGMVGDPSGKSAERNLLSEDTLQHNLNGIQKQLEKFLDFNSAANSAEMVNNYDWFKEFSFLNFIRDVGKHITVNYMMAKDSVKNRISGDTGMSFTEFTYQLVQGYDFYYLWKNKNCVLQMGGSDQWGNIVTGTELIRRKDAGEAYALTTQLIKKSDGTKFGKTEGGNIWLDPEKTSPYKFYQFWLNTSDADAKTYIRIFTLFDQDTIIALETEQDAAPHLRTLQKALAKDITIRVHGEAEYEKAIKSSEFLFGNTGIEFLNELNDAEVIGLFEGVPNFTIAKSELIEGINATELLAGKTAVFASKGEAKKMIQGGGVAINKQKIGTADDVYQADALINGKFLVAQKGKKNYFLIIAE